MPPFPNVQYMYIFTERFIARFLLLVETNKENILILNKILIYYLLLKRILNES